MDRRITALRTTARRMRAHPTQALQPWVDCILKAMAAATDTRRRRSTGATAAAIAGA